MRISDRLRYEMFKSDLLRMKSHLDKFQAIVSSGKALLEPSDNPVDFSQSMRFDAELKRKEQYERNVSRLLLFGSYYDSALNKIHELLTKAKEIAISQASDTMDASTRLSSSEEIKGIIEQLVAIGNTNLSGMYIFSGRAIDRKPFELNDDYTVSYNGTEDVMKVAVEKEIEADLGMSGLQVLDDDLFSTLKNLKDALESNDGEGIRESLDGLDRALRKTEANLAYVGTSVGKLERIIDLIKTRKTDIQVLQSEIQDADLTKVISDFNAMTLAYQTMLYAMAKIQELSILNYLR
ncbi:MAG: flagellar hook-associated protein FlgL [Desulfobacterota bacterium]|nr:flagellar hook-associated protein FlgL [Thermodesulfobacteriota bacterium]MDW8002556.1 flagellar hook-associated protein FlgL [Deltaproteobacteria bacterium]